MNKNIFCEMVGIKYPIIQGAMAWIADSSLASAVSNAGGLGIIAAGNAPVEIVREEIRKTKILTDKPFGVNIMLLSPYAEDIAKMVCEEGVKVVTTGAGNPGKYISMWKEHGIKVIPVVPSVALAKRMERAGADAVVTEGCEAGGHIGELTTMTLLPQVVDELKIPVIAAGGIGDKRGVAAAFMLGASAVQVGTRFLVAKECTVHQNYKNKIIKAKDIDTVVTGRSTGHPVRVLRNKLTRQFQLLEKENVSMEELDELGKGALVKAVKDGDIENGSLMAGQIAGLIAKEESCEEIIKEMFDIKVVLESLSKDGRLNYGE
ncbi:MAG: enoyl-[acyl-carrier-protein] reductase FabK [Clostridiaceae bacterium]